MKRSQFKRRITGDMNKSIRHFMIEKFNEVIEFLKDAIISEYDEELVDVVTDRKSKTNPNLYREEFIERLDEFEYIDKDSADGKIAFNVPDMETFDFSGRLRVLQAIMEGTSGNYVEINEDDYKAVFGKRPINEDPVDDYVSPKDQIYLVRYNNTIRRAERNLNKKFVKYPFSNTPPIRVLEEGVQYARGNVKGWISEALTSAQKQFVNNYKGARL